jgi:hypothetical protein
MDEAAVSGRVDRPHFIDIVLGVAESLTPLAGARQVSPSRPRHVTRHLEAGNNPGLPPDSPPTPTAIWMADGRERRHGPRGAFWGHSRRRG